MPVYSVHVYAPTINPFWSNTSEGFMYNVSGTSTVGSFNVVDILDDDAFLNDSDSGARNGTFVDNSQQVIDGTSTPIQGFFSIEIYNATTGEFGRAFLLTTGSASPQSVSDGLGWVFTTPVSPGDTIDWLPTVNTQNPPHNENFSWGEVSYSDIIPCYARGTHILTPGGDVLVENLRVGSRVETLDHGPQTVRWIGSAKRAATGACAPVRIRADALENDRDLWVSQQHRMVLRGAKAELMFGEHEVFVPAKSLVNDCSVRIIEGGEVEYFHILFDTHEIIFAEGAMAESLHLGKQSFDALSYASRQEIKMLFPELDRAGTKLPQTARQVLRNYEVQALLRAV